MSFNHNFTHPKTLARLLYLHGIWIHENENIKIRKFQEVKLGNISLDEMSKLLFIHPQYKIQKERIQFLPNKISQKTRTNMLDFKNWTAYFQTLLIAPRPTRAFRYNCKILKQFSTPQSYIIKEKVTPQKKNVNHKYNMPFNYRCIHSKKPDRTLSKCGTCIHENESLNII